LLKDQVLSKRDYYINYKKNRSLLYLFPLLYDEKIITTTKLRNLNDNGFLLVNLYLADKTYQHTDIYKDNISTIFMLLYIEDYDNPEFKDFMIKIKNHIFYKEFYSIDLDKIMIVFECNEDCSKIISLFKQGKYSKFPDFYRAYFIGAANYKVDSCYNIITKNPFLKSKIEQDLDIKLSSRAELDDIPYENQETYVKKE